MSEIYGIDHIHLSISSVALMSWGALRANGAASKERLPDDAPLESGSPPSARHSAAG